MYSAIIFYVFVTSSTSWSKVITDEKPSCSRITEFACHDGSCVRLEQYCDGTLDCGDGSDETTCDVAQYEEQVSQRYKRQATCGKEQSKCRDGTCISTSHKCNGVRDCPDGSDETFALCRKAPCKSNQFRCTYGACVEGTAPCNKVQDCADNSDELLHRCRNQTKEVRGMFKCDNGQEIVANGHCDGDKDCADGSDETLKACADNTCHPHQFHCAYGACIGSSIFYLFYVELMCNNIKDCADGSDESDEICNRLASIPVPSVGRFKCDNGHEIEAFGLCDGAKDCADGSDETLKACANNTCLPYQFHCAYGACVGSRLSYGDFMCNNIEDCADGSDESDKLCNRLASIPVPSVADAAKEDKNAEAAKEEKNQQSGGSCVLPPYPPNGRYRVSNVPGAVPGRNFLFVGLNITCDPGYRLTGSVERLCVDGVWLPSIVTNNECARFCRLDKDPSVRFRCLLTGNSDGSRECNEYEPEGTFVAPACNAPNYYHMGVLRYMRCINGQWDNVARCYPVCGRVVPAGIDLIVGGRPAERGELPWHAGIYRKTTNPFMQICGGSLVSSKVVISAAHCFWDDVTKAQPASNYAVALGKLYRPWAYGGDIDVQRSDVADIKMSRYFQGRTANFQEDIAIVLLVSVIEFRPHIRPVCVDFSETFEDRQLSPGNMGKVAGWGLAEENGNPSQFLKVVELPVISIQECQMDAPSSFRELITADKLCAGFRKGIAVCKGDSGGGLTFPDTEQGFLRYHLRGVVSTAPKGESLCNANSLTTFTLISSHEKFILKYL